MNLDVMPYGWLQVCQQMRQRTPAGKQMRLLCPRVLPKHRTRLQRGCSTGRARKGGGGGLHLHSEAINERQQVGGPRVRLQPQEYALLQRVLNRGVPRGWKMR